MDTPTPPPPPPAPIPQEPPVVYVRPVPPPPEDPVWKISDVLMIAGFAFVAQVALVGLALAVAHSMRHFHGVSTKDLATNALVIVPAELAGYLLLLAFMAHIVVAKYRARFFRSLSWNLPAGHVAAIALGGGAAFAVISDVASTLLSRWIPKSLPIDQLFRDTTSAYIVAMFGIFVAPFIEELFFRGFLYPVLARGVGIAWAVVITSVAFAAIHSPQLASAWVPLGVILSFSIVLTVVRARTKSVATTVLIHMGYNATLFAQLYFVTQGFRHMEKA